MKRLPRTFIQVTLDILVSLATYIFICMLLSKKGSFAFCTLRQKFILVARNSSNKLTSHLLHVCIKTDPRRCGVIIYSLALPLTGPLLLFFELTSYLQKSVNVNIWKCQ